jgi:cob(I)alamin adenosyltransferase
VGGVLYRSQPHPGCSRPKVTTTTLDPCRFRIYTKTGDHGTAALYNGQRRAKDDDVFHALGDVDELNSAIGVAQDFCTSGQQQLQQQVRQVCCRAFNGVSSHSCTTKNQ